MSQLVTRPSGGAITVVDNGPLVSAIVVTRNRESHLRECLSGVLEQSISDRIEVIVVDLGSEQCEWAVVAELQKRHQNLVALKVPAASAATGINMALKIASGKYLAVLDATDRLKRDACGQLAAALENDPTAMLAYGDTCFTAIPHETFANHTSYGKVIWPDYTPQQLTQLSEVAPHPLWRRELHDSIGFLPEGYPNHGMREFLLKVVERFRILHLQEFTGLKLIAGTAQPAQAAHPAAAPIQQQPAAVSQPQPQPVTVSQPITVSQPVTFSQRAPVSQPQPEQAAGPDEAYAALRPLLSGSDMEQAAAALRRHLATYPRHAVAHNDLAAIAYQLGDKEQALKHYREAVWLEPNESVYLKNLADLLYVEAGGTDEAIGIYLKLLENSPRDTETLLNLGIICEGVGQPAEAESFYQRALEIEPWNKPVRERLTDLRGRMAEGAGGEHDTAHETAQQTAEDETAEDRYQRSQELVAEGDLDGAARELAGILSCYPEFAPAHNDLAVLSYQHGEKGQARIHYEKAAKLAPGNSTFQKNLADFYFVEGYDVDGAIAIYLEQLRKEPKNIETLMSLGKICTILDRPQEAQSFYGKVTQLEPWNRDARECLNTLRQAANG